MRGRLVPTFGVRVGWLLALLATSGLGCGRIGFQPAGDAGVDAQAPDARVDATPARDASADATAAHDASADAAPPRDATTRDAGCRTTVPTTGLIGYWSFDEMSGTTAADQAGGHDGTLMGGATWTTGRIGGAVSLDGVTGHVEIAGTVAYATQNAPFSFSAWFRLVDFSMAGVPDIMQIRSDTTSPFHVIVGNESNYDGLSLGSGDGSWATIKTQVEPSTGVWHHVAMVYDGTGAGDLTHFTLYLDGVVQPEVVASPYAVQAEQSRIGAAEVQDNQWHGDIDEVRIYDRALGSDEVHELATECP